MLNIAKCHFCENNRKLLMRFVTSPKAQYVYYQWQIMEIQQVVSLHLDKGLFLCAFVGNSTDIAVMITTFLIHMSVLAGQGAPVSFSMKFSMNRGLNSE